MIEDRLFPSANSDPSKPSKPSNQDAVILRLVIRPPCFKPCMSMDECRCVVVCPNESVNAVILSLKIGLPFIEPCVSVDVCLCVFMYLFELVTVRGGALR